MQVNTAQGNDALARQKQRLQQHAQQDRARAEELKADGTQDLFQANDKQQIADESREKGKELRQESNRLRRNGREQSARGLSRLAESSDTYSDSFAQQESGLADLKESAASIQRATDSKSEALGKIGSGLAEQTAHNLKQSGNASDLAETNNSNGEVIGQKQSSINNLNQNVDARGEVLNQQTERVADFILAGADYDAASKTKSDGIQTLGQGVEHRVNAESLGDAKGQQELQKTWAESDAARHDKADKSLLFGSLYESLKAQASKLNASFHENAAARGDAKASELDACASQMKAQANSVFHHGRVLEHSGQQHVAIGQQMKCCPWTYCQGVALERQGLAELAQAQSLKAQAQSMKAQAQEKAIQAETARVKAEQAREVSQDLKVEGHGSEVRSEILGNRSDAHEQKADKARGIASDSAAAAERLDEAASGQMEQAKTLQKRGVRQFADGMTEQHQALGTQGGALQGLNDSVDTESSLQSQATEQTNGIASSLSAGRSFLARTGSLLGSLHSSVQAEGESQEKIQAGIEQFQTGIGDSQTASSKAEKAAELLSQARDLELEGLRLQNSGQKMLLSARPKMADAAKLSAQSFDAFNEADRNESQAEKLIQEGNEKMAAAEILKQKAQAYQTLAESV